MYVQPNTTIKLIKNCPLDPDYQNTIYFQSKTAQTNYFINSLTGYTFQNNSYQRVEKGKMRVAMNAESLYNCNYLAFQNASFGTKWFYAFVTGIEYINNVTSEVSYSIDLMQTWHFDYVMDYCFVEREHSLTDEIGDNLVPENIDTGEFVIDDLIEPAQLQGNTSRKLAFWCTFDQYNDPGGGTIFNVGHGNYYSGLVPHVYDMTVAGLQAAQSWLSGIHAVSLNGLVSCCIIPSISQNADTSVNDVTISKKTTLLRADGTNVKNKKCLTYPYNFLYVTNNQGRTAVYRYEFFSTTNCVLHLFADESTNPTVLIYPLNYKGLAVNFDEKLDFSGYPQIAMNIDSFKAWLAQNASSLGINALAAGVLGTEITAGTSSALVPASMAGAGASFIGAAAIPAAAAIPLIGLASSAVSGAIHSMMPPQARGAQGSNVLLALDKMNFGIMHKHITPEFATIIDDYFNMFGYATNKVKIPNRYHRPYWNYVKTIGCKIQPEQNGGLPADDAKAIESIYNAGITFWNNPAYIGDYTQDNSPT